MRRVPGVLLVLVALVAFGAAGYILVHDDPVKHAGALPPLPTPSSSAATVSGSEGSPVGASPRPLVAFLGDDWTAGLGASAKRNRFTTLVARALHVHEHNFGTDQGGYAATSADGQDYGARIDDIVAAKPQFVVVAGGRNDVLNSDVDTASTHATSLFRTLHRRLPDATLIAITPTWGDSEPPAALGELAGAIKQAVTAVGGTYLSVRDPVRGHPADMADDADPDDSGHAAIARALIPRLRPLLAT